MYRTFLPAEKIFTLRIRADTCSICGVWDILHAIVQHMTQSESTAQLSALDQVQATLDELKVAGVALCDYLARRGELGKEDRDALLASIGAIGTVTEALQVGMQSPEALAALQASDVLAGARQLTAQAQVVLSN